MHCVIKVFFLTLATGWVFAASDPVRPLMEHRKGQHFRMQKSLDQKRLMAIDALEKEGVWLWLEGNTLHIGLVHEKIFKKQNDNMVANEGRRLLKKVSWLLEGFNHRVVTLTPYMAREPSAPYGLWASAKEQAWGQSYRIFQDLSQRLSMPFILQDVHEGSSCEAIGKSSWSYTLIKVQI